MECVIDENHLNIYCVVAHKSEEGLVQVGDTLKMGTLGRTRNFLCYSNPTQIFLENDRVASSTYH